MKANYQLIPITIKEARKHMLHPDPNTRYYKAITHKFTLESWHNMYSKITHLENHYPVKIFLGFFANKQARNAYNHYIDHYLEYN